MLSGQKLDVYFNLQEILLNTEDTGSLLEKLFPKILDRLDSADINCQFIAALFLSSENEGNLLSSGNQIQKQYFVDKKEESSKNPINWQVIVANLSSWEKELLWNPLIIDKSKNAQILDNLISSYADQKMIESLVVFPLLISHKMVGISLFATSDKKIEQEFVEFTELLSNLISLAYRLEDTQISLTKIGQQVYEMNAKLHQLDKLKDEFVSVASHELRTPMTAIRSYAWMALNRSDIPLTEKLKRYLSRTLVSTERLISLVNDMLNVSRIESGHIEISPKPFDIVALVKDIMEEVKVKADEKKLQLISLEQNTPAVFADADKVHEILLNLLGNALKFSYPGGTITVSFFTDGQMVDVSVKDSGCGITKEDLSKLFHKFSRLDNSYTSVSTSGGTGLGLYISKSLVELMHGKIWVSSEGLDKGSTFSFSLPVASQQVLQHADDFKVKAEGEAKPLESVII